MHMKKSQSNVGGWSLTVMSGNRHEAAAHQSDIQGSLIVRIRKESKYTTNGFPLTRLLMLLPSALLPADFYRERERL